MEYEGVDANSFTVNLKHKKFPWILVLCAGLFFAIIVPVILVQGQPKTEDISNLAEPVPLNTEIAVDEIIIPDPVAVPQPIIEPEPTSVLPDPVVEETVAPVAEPPQPEPTQPEPVVDLPPAPVAPVVNDPQFRICADANAAGYGNYVRGIDPEYEWYIDRDSDGENCEF